MITIRKFKEEDALEASYLIRKTLSEENSKFYPDSVIKYMYNEFSPKFLIDLSKVREFFVAIQKSKIVGTITIVNDYIGTVFVNPEDHNKGIGKKLMETIESMPTPQGEDTDAAVETTPPPKVVKDLSKLFIQDAGGTPPPELKELVKAMESMSPPEEKN